MYMFNVTMHPTNYAKCVCVCVFWDVGRRCGGGGGEREKYHSLVGLAVGSSAEIK